MDKKKSSTQVGQTSSSRTRARVISEWRGSVDPPHPERNIHQAGDCIESLLKKAGLSEGVEIQSIRSSWREITDEFIASHTEPVSLHRGLLTLRILHPTMRFHILQSREQLKNRLQKKLGEKLIRDLRIQHG